MFKSVFEGCFAASRPDGATPKKGKNPLLEMKGISRSAVARWINFDERHGQKDP
jgi:hypothetical protein